MAYGYITTPKASGYTLHETDDIVVIATVESTNVKTGNMIQVWILTRAINPIEAIKLGLDNRVCFDCIHRGPFGERTCYVDIAKAPLSVWNAYQNGSYPYLPESRYADVFAGRAVRFGAYGDPVLIPFGKASLIALYATKWTGYTHQWRKAEYAAWRTLVMASCDSAEDYRAAKSAGWRTFRVRGASEPMGPREIACPASDEAGNRTTCERCGLCAGSTGSQDPRKDVSIIVHGVGARNFVPLTAIA